MKLESALELKRNLVALTRDRVMRAHAEALEARALAHFAGKRKGPQLASRAASVAFGVAPQDG